MERNAYIENTVASIKMDFRSRGLTYTDAAAMLGTTRAAVAMQLSGTRPFSAKSAELWARVFDYSPTRLLFGTGPLYADGTDVVDDKSVALFLHRNTMERLNEARTEYEQSSRRSLHWDDVMQNLMDSAGIP